MAAQQSCPGCGETDNLTGVRRDGDIEISCERCGSRWMRGSARCRACGGDAAVTRPQLMTRHPRGTLLSVVGRRRLVLCPRCDAAVIGPEESDAPVPEGYVSRFVAGDPAPDPGRSAPRSTAPRQRRSATRRVQSPGMRPRSEPGRTTPELPTVRQATERFLEEHPDADSLAMLLLGQHLGPSTRLGRLDDAAARALESWAEATWPDRTQESAGRAVDTVRAAAAYWHAHGWVEHDLARGLASDPPSR